MAIILPFLHPLLAFAASVRGMSIRLMAADSNSNPKTSSSYHRVLNDPSTVCPFHGEGGKACNFFALSIFTTSDIISGRKAIGRTIAQRP